MNALEWLGLWFAVGLVGTIALFRRYYMPKEHTSPEPPPGVLDLAPNLAVQATPKKDMLTIVCTSIRDHEGKPGSLNYLLNNPGDCRPSPVGYLPKYGHVEIIDTDTDPRYLYHKGKFAKFTNYDLGWEYLQALIHSYAVIHPEWTLLDLFKHYAPSGDNNNPNKYAIFVAKRCGVSVDITLRSLFA